MVFNYTDGTTKKFYANFSPDILDWQFLSAVFIPEKDYSSFTISYAYCHQLNDAWFTGLALFLEEFGQTYAYDDKDRVTSSLDI